MMKTKEQVEAEFRKDLKELLERYDAEMSADHYIEHGGGARIIVDIPGIYDRDHGNTLREPTEIDLGQYVRI